MNLVETTAGIGAVTGAGALGCLGYHVHWWLGMMGLSAGLILGWYIGILAGIILMSPFIVFEWWEERGQKPYPKFEDFP